MAAQEAARATVDHDLLTDGIIERRLYQLDLATTARNDHTLVCLPTGLGKTTVSLLVTVDRLTEVGGKAVMLAPTKPLVQQHADFYREAMSIDSDDIVVLTGETPPDERATIWEQARVILATPQVIENDLIGDRIDLSDVTHLTFDECHRARGEYAYGYIAERYHADADNPLVTGMSASPGGDAEEINAVCANLGIEEVAVKTESDPDVEEYTYETDIEWERVELPEEIEEIRDQIREVISERLETLVDAGVASTTSPDLSQKQLNKMRGRLQSLIDDGEPAGFQGMSAHAEIMKLRRAVTLAETQSVEALEEYFERQANAARSSGASKATQRFVSDPRVKRARRGAQTFEGRHPKSERTRAILAETLGIEGGDRAIVFTESRDTAETLTAFLGEFFETRRFVGQSSTDGSEGMTQNEQQAVLEAFRNGEFEVLVSTSVAEEGLDVPEVDLVLFYEPVPTAIRAIQRKGRTGRQATGRVVVLITEDTRDEAYFWLSKQREEEMNEELEALKAVAEDFGEEDSQPQPEPLEDDQAALDQFEPEPTEAEPVEDPPTPGTETDTTEIIADQRELDSTIGRDLSKREDLSVRLETLDVGDYICSDRVAIERKTVDDFMDTLLGSDRSLFEQVKALSTNYSRPTIILEGDGLYDRRNVHPNAIRGALASLVADYGVSILQTADEAETAGLLATIATREQQQANRDVQVHGEKHTKTLSEQQEYVVSSIADIGPVTARALLSTFGTIEAVMTADEETLLEVEGVGEVTAERIRSIVAAEYDPS